MEWERREFVSYFIFELCDRLKVFPLQLADDIKSLDANLIHIRAARRSWLTEGAECGPRNSSGNKGDYASNPL